jgi:hypothetical protein
MIAFRCAREDRFPELCVMKADGTAQRRLTRNAAGDG